MPERFRDRKDKAIQIDAVTPPPENLEYDYEQTSTLSKFLGGGLVVDALSAIDAKGRARSQRDNEQRQQQRLAEGDARRQEIQDISAPMDQSLQDTVSQNQQFIRDQERAPFLAQGKAIPDRLQTEEERQAAQDDRPNPLLGISPNQLRDMGFDGKPVKTETSDGRIGGAGVVSDYPSAPQVVDLGSEIDEPEAPQPVAPEIAQPEAPVSEPEQTAQSVADNARADLIEKFGSYEDIPDAQKRRLDRMQTDIDRRKSAQEAQVAKRDQRRVDRQQKTANVVTDEVQRNSSGGAFVSVQGQGGGSLDLPMEDIGGGVFAPASSNLYTGQQLGSAIIGSPNVRQGIDALVTNAADSGVQGAAFTEYTNARDAYDKLSSGDSNLSSAQQKDALRQAQVSMGRAAKAVVGRSSEIQTATARTARQTGASEQDRIDGIMRRSQGLLQDDSKKRFGTALTPQQAIRQAMLEEQQSTAMREHIASVMQGEETAIPAGMANMVESSRGRVGGMVTKLTGEDVARVSGHMRTNYSDQIDYGVTVGPDNGMMLVSNQGYRFAGAIHPASEVPVAVVGNEIQEEQAKAAGIPYVIDREPNKIYQPFQKEDAKTKRDAIGLGAFDLDIDREEIFEEVTPEVDEAYDGVLGLLDEIDAFGGQRSAFNVLTQELGAAGDRGDKSELGFEELGQLQQLAQDNPKLQDALATLGVTADTESLQRRQSPDANLDPDSVEFRAFELYGRMQTERNRLLDESFRGKHGDSLDIARDKVTSGKADPEYAADFLAYQKQTMSGRISKPAFKREFMKQEIETRLAERQEMRQLQQDVLDGMTGSPATQAGRAKLEKNYTRSFDRSSGQPTMLAYDGATANAAFSLRPLPALQGTNGVDVPVVSQWSDMSHVAFDTPFIASKTDSNGNSVTAEAIIDADEINELMAPVYSNRSQWANPNFQSSDAYTDSVVGVMKMLMGSLPEGYFGNRDDLKIAAVQLIRRQGYKNRDDQNSVEGF